ncbi:hypothetical protein BBI15_07545 [Planococcus plakortidis]|uniref:Oligosaccharide repeat unit polymerase n=1 Tax=Planococcus plakortidis TaxID=1038856 RepID=A0A1C7E8M2_9BACL|nr:O-antigen polymerase [Planococcus plakortidis]ANU20078.1 hypothetical protein BBI15_07545 [Planococcus plakortidis]
MNRANYLVYFFLLMSCAISVVFACIPNPICNLIAIVILNTVIISTVKLNIIHPFVWYIPIFSLYSFGNLILVLFGNEIYTNATWELFIIQYVFLVTLIVVISPKVYTLKIEKKWMKSEFDVYRVVSVILAVLGSFYIVYLYSTGLTSKYDIKLSSSPIDFLALSFNFLFVTFSFYLIYKINKNREFPYLIYFIYIVWLIIVFSVNGERDLLLKGFWVGIFIYHVYYREISKKIVMLIAILVIITMPFLQNLKSFSTKGINLTLDDNIFISIVNSEFVAASRNLATLVLNQSKWDFKYGETLIWDIQSAFLNIAGSPTLWFNQTFYPNLLSRGGGSGFSIIGEGYLNFGMIGVILWGIMVGFTIKLLYKYGSNNFYIMNIYILTMPLVIYVTRADFATLMSQFSKQIIIPILVIFLINKVYKQYYFSKKVERTKEFEK